MFVDKRDYEGPLWEQVDGAFQFVLRNIRLGARIEGLYRIDEYELPPDSIRELIVNAVMNCSYLQASHVQVAIYDDRLEITTPGGLMPNVTIERMKEGYSQIRNRALVHAFSYMNMMEGWGIGIPRLLKDMEAYGLREPEFIDMDSAFRVNLYRASVETEREKSAGEVPGKAGSAGKAPETIVVAPEKEAATPLNHSREKDLGRNDEKRAGKMPEKDDAVGPGSLSTCAESLMISEMPIQYRAVYRYASDNGDITTEDVQRILGIKDRRARTILKEMVDQHLLIRKGASRSTRYSVA